MENSRKYQKKISSLSAIQYRVTQEGKTQQAYQNEYYLTKDSGHYRCIVCEKQLFSSEDKYDSGCGWPAFTAELESASIWKIADKKNPKKVELQCCECRAHLGHIFQRKSVTMDPKQNINGKRYCVNSASLKFEPRD